MGCWVAATKAKEWKSVGRLGELNWLLVLAENNVGWSSGLSGDVKEGERDPRSGRLVIDPLKIPTAEQGGVRPLPASSSLGALCWATPCGRAIQLRLRACPASFMCVHFLSPHPHDHTPPPPQPMAMRGGSTGILGRIHGTAQEEGGRCQGFGGERH